MNPSVAPAPSNNAIANLYDIGALTHLMEAATALAKLTGNSAESNDAAASLWGRPMQQQQQQQQQQQFHNPLTALLSQRLTTTTLNYSSSPPLSQEVARAPPRNIISDEEESEGKTDTAPSTTGTATTISSRITAKEIFPERLMAILNDSSLSDIVTWLPHGRSFVIIRPDVFTETVLPKYLPPVDAKASTKYTSFTRKLNRW
jgi:hypothetical protein